MSTVDQSPLGNFEHRLLTELTAHISAHSAPAARVTAPIRRRRRYWRPSPGALTAAAAVAAVVVLAAFGARSGVQPALAQTFPIVTQRPQRLPVSMQQILETQRLASGVRPFARDRAFAFQTPSGIGYVVVDPRNLWLCILIPDLETGASVHCETTSRLLSRTSIGLQLSTRNHDENELVWLLPNGSTATTITADGEIRRVVLENGVLAILTRHPVTITTTVRGRQTTIVYPNK